MKPVREHPNAIEAARLVSRMLIETESVHFNADKPFIFTAGWASPVYIDCRRLIAFPRVRRKLVELADENLGREVGFESFDAVAGGETAGIPYAAWIADRLMLPMQYVRKKPKGFGRMAQIEGKLDEGDRVLLVEDLTSDGGSKINFCEAIRNAGASVEHAFVVFYYSIFPHANANFEKAGITLHYLATWWDVLEAARASGYFESRTLDEVEKFLNDPVGWSGAHGGRSEAPA
ncbi:MAG: orotate phosphoribosyltransferase [Minwuia sp.]|uniref:orotate phosphoribosyltransferase n=1 Tax=Minwuia sp. TaxID=2493630 RepID=UPI003A8B8676